MHTPRQAQTSHCVWNHCLVIVVIGLCAVAQGQETKPPADQPQGFGAVAKGGRGGRVIDVTTLGDSGPGSLRAALDAKGPRLVHFSVEGSIELKTPLRVTEGRVTIDGST
ncbi:MAG: hypothetical protein ACYSWU_20020, partial [Planctomycetota bacterium]